MAVAADTNVGALTLVLIEDSDDVRYLIGAMLGRDPQFDILAEAGDAASGIVAAAQHQPDAIVLDVGLPDRSGLDIIGELRAAAPMARIVVLSGDHRPERNAEVVASGAHAYIAKRDATSRLLTVLRALLPAG